MRPLLKGIPQCTKAHLKNLGFELGPPLEFPLSLPHPSDECVEHFRALLPWFRFMIRAPQAVMINDIQMQSLPAWRHRDTPLDGGLMTCCGCRGTGWSYLQVNKGLETCEPDPGCVIQNP